MKRSIKFTLIAVPTVLVVAAATAFATDAPPFGSDEIQGADRDRAVKAAIAHVGGGTAISTEDRDEDSPYEVEVRTDAGAVVDVDLDDSFRVIGTDSDDDRYDDDRSGGTTDNAGTAGTGGTGDDDRFDDDRGDAQLTAADRAKAETAALAKVGAGSSVIETDISDDGTRFDVEVRKADGTSVDVDLDSDFQVIRVETDEDRFED